MTTSSRVLWRSETAVACLVYLAFGMPVAMLGVAWPTLRDELGRADSDLGVLVLAYGLGRLVTSASSGPLLAPLAVLVAASVAGGVLLVLAPRVRATIASGT
ncbi:MAG: hypothetical protein ABW008_03185 [Acidimicrobiales bacterium]